MSVLLQKTVDVRLIVDYGVKGEGITLALGLHEAVCNHKCSLVEVGKIFVVDLTNRYVQWKVRVGAYVGKDLIKCIECNALLHSKVRGNGLHLERMKVYLQPGVHRSEPRVNVVVLLIHITYFPCPVRR